MLPYKLTRLAEEDIKRVARYTLKHWGKKQFMHYAELLDNHFRNIALGNMHSRSFLDNLPQVEVSLCEHYYIFYIHPNNKPPVIIAVLHERMDLLTRLKARLV